MPTSDIYNTNYVIEVKNGSITGEPKRRPNWFDSSGEYLTDEQFIQRENLYPLLRGDETKPQYDDYYQFLQKNAITDWNVFNDRVEVTWEILDEDIETVRSREINNLSKKRWRVETGGMTFEDESQNVLKIHTDRESQSKIIGSAQAAKDDMRTDGSKWKTFDGFISISNSDMISLGYSLLDFVQSCYNREEIVGNLLLDTSNTINDIKNIVNNEFNNGWPVNSLGG